MEQWRKDARREAVITDLEALVPKEHLLRKIEKVMDYEWLYERLDPYYCHDNGRPGTDPVCTAQRNHRESLCGCKREARHAIYTPQRSGRSHKMGQAEICCHESEKAGKMELGELHFFQIYYAISRLYSQPPVFAWQKPGVL